MDSLHRAEYESELDGAHPATTILYVEDEPFVRNVTCEILRNAGYRVLIATNALEARMAYRDYGSEIELLLTDVILPGESGRELAASLKRQNPWLAVLFVTGYAEQVGRAEETGVRWLAKPYAAEILLETVSQLLEAEGLRTAAALTHVCADAQLA